ncbi:MAG: Tim44/TimA family putative adaptor protein [Pseudomonadota bacterium]
MESSNLVTLVFVVAAVFVFLQLRSVLGKRTGHQQRPPFDPTAKPAESPESDKDNDNVITLPGVGKAQEDPYKNIDAIANPRTKINRGLRKIKDAAPIFDPKEFTKGAGMAYEMIVMAFADGDRKTLKNLLAKDVYDGFSAALDERAESGEVVQTNFVGIEDITITGAELRDHDAHVTVSVVSQLISATRDKAGDVIDGDPEAVVEVSDVWTFARDVRQNDPNWKLVATESDD